MLLPYEVFLKDSNFCLLQAEEILEHGWKLKGYRAIPLSEIPWGKGDAESRTLAFWLHSLQPVETLLRAFSRFGERRFLETALKVALDWCQQADSCTSPLVWDGMASAVRAHRLAFILDAGEDAQLLSEAEKDVLWKILVRHQRFLEEDANIDFHNNHGYFQVACQMAMGRRLKRRAPQMGQALEQGKARMMAMLEQQFTAENIHKENSPAYFKLVYETLASIADSGLLDSLEPRLHAMEDALSCFVMPDQRLAMLGDTDSISLATTVTNAKKRWRGELMRYAVTGGRCGTAPEDGLKVFPESGYAMVRVRDTKGTYNTGSYLLLNAAFHSRTHKHADDLSVLWADRGANILVDAGRYGYLGKTKQGDELWSDGFWYSDPHRIYCESTHAHNTLQIDGRNTERRGVKPYGSALTRWGKRGDVFWIEAECKHFKSIRHARLLFFRPGKWLIVFDWFYDNNKDGHDVKQWFHLAPEVDLVKGNNGYMAFIPQTNVPLKIIPLFASMSLSSCILGQGEAEQGWHSPYEKLLVPNYSFSMGCSGSSGALATLFTFSESCESNHSFSRVNTSGRNGQFKWKDDVGNHTLQFQRMESGVEIAYRCGGN